ADPQEYRSGRQDGEPEEQERRDAAERIESQRQEEGPPRVVPATRQEALVVSEDGVVERAPELACVDAGARGRAGQLVAESEEGVLIAAEEVRDLLGGD